MFEKALESLPNDFKVYLIIIVILLALIDITIFRFYLFYKKLHKNPNNGHVQDFKMKAK